VKKWIFSRHLVPLSSAGLWAGPVAIPFENYNHHCFMSLLLSPSFQFQVSICSISEQKNDQNMELPAMLAFWEVFIFSFGFKWSAKTPICPLKSKATLKVTGF
jgi:hypothetical protein